jgi:hypothetical protein
MSATTKASLRLWAGKAVDLADSRFFAPRVEEAQSGGSRKKPEKQREIAELFLSVL